VDLPWLDGFSPAKKASRLPVVLTKDEVKRILQHLSGANWLIASLLYGSGLRLQEALRLRVKDLDFGFRQIVVRNGKGAKDRLTVLPTALIEPLQKQLSEARKIHEQDLRRVCKKNCVNCSNRQILISVTRSKN
jgi:integrase